MAQSKIINKETIYRTGSHTLRLMPTGGNLYVQVYSGGSWSNAISWGEPGNSNNEFNWIVENEKLKIQQIKDGGSWEGVEGVDFTTIAEFNKI